MAKSLLVISRQAPWSGPSAREALDVVLAGGAFDLPIGLLFMDDGVFQLATHQDAKAVQQKDLSANLQALGLFGIDEVFACSHSLAERSLATPASAQALDSAAIAELIDRYDQVMTL
ncbi:sulfurtransferase complex subunit TusC [Pseudomonas edaphica]|uniref:Sulfurtransferase complex subunit TusC n=1 Tax=Pseudomonas edaphica TaxID=2006980 RepID=A0A7Y8FNP7_9PSED|nr:MULTISPECIES: sulfurtransferase complex subunit TusC [Pseudomonas]NWC49363.1 sulfurtransferase complex subunit TusC [Pseudomonas sp. IPO3747]NWE06917.1 sulfurtransferase complex subunit TusC [Pseudomonas edaphica]NWE82712.1 sulfurtransferase complex subunit TusC [Pseudomonas edaphica]